MSYTKLLFGGYPIGWDGDGIYVLITDAFFGSTRQHYVKIVEFDKLESLMAQGYTPIYVRYEDLYTPIRIK